MSEVDFLKNGNYTKNLSEMEIEMISRFYNLTERNMKITSDAYENSVFYYNGISVVLLFMLTGGLIGILVMVYLSIDWGKSNENFYENMKFL